MGRYDKPDNFERDDEKGANGQDEVYSKAVRAGKRTYFFDVKSTRRGDYYFTITESKKRFGRDGKFHFEKHKIFLYKEDFDKFLESLNETLEFCNSHNLELIDEEVDLANNETEKDEELAEFEKKHFR